MVVRFHCPNGHVLTAPESLTGKPGKCPKCQSAFIVPASSDPGASDTVAVGSSPSSFPATAGGSGPGSAPRAPTGEMFVFLCPNGHRLNGPPSLKGKPGKCPHCQATFLIPNDEPPPQETISYAEAAYGETEEIASDEPPPEEEEPPFPDPADMHPMAHIVARMWRNRGPHGDLELSLPEGEIFTPEFFSPHLSQRDYGVFASREGERFQFVVIPWANVKRVSVHRAERLPPGWFESDEVR